VAPNLVNAGKLLQCNNVDCRVPPTPSQTVIPRRAQSIDYMAKDYDSFLRAILDLIPSRIPGWQTRTEADLAMAMLELFAYVGDELSYYQDRVANEGFLDTAVEYDSVRRLLSLIDYKLDPGVAAKVFLTVVTTGAKFVPKGFAVSTKAVDKHPAIAFEVSQDRIIYPDLNQINLKTDVASYATQAVLDGEFDTFLAAGEWIRLVDNAGAEWAQLQSPITFNTVQHTTTVTFQHPLVGNYAAATTQILGNVLVATNGQSVEQIATGTGLANQQIELDFAPLTYVQTADGQVQSSLLVEVGGVTWDQVEDFIDSGPTDPHYAITRDNGGFITVGFGSRQQGRAPGVGETIVVRYRYGVGEDGLVAAGTITQFSDPDQLITSVSNPEPSFGARNPEDLATAKLVGPRTLRDQNRAVTADDYANALLQGVQEGGQTFTPLHAKAQFVWTGSWNTVIVSVDFADRQPLDTVPGREQALEDALNAKRLAGYDIKVEDARYAPLQVGLALHVKPDFFVKQVRQAVDQALGPAGFFAPSHFGFGDPVRLSDLYAAVLKVEGVQYITMSHFKRLGDRYPDETAQGVIDIDPLEIARCDNDPAHPENGVLSLRTCGGIEGQ
jgi:hypothetical protein